jgi:hypothetical protein
LIEEFLAQKVELTHVIDTSGLIIPGHGTPTVILIGRNMLPTTRPVRAALRVRGQPPGWEDAAEGPVWRAIIEQIGKPGSESEWISVVDLPRDHLATHPWSLSGGGSVTLMSHLEKAASTRLGDNLLHPIGFAGFSANDEVFYFPQAWHSRHGTPEEFVRPLIAGKAIKSWVFDPSSYAIAPYTGDGQLIHIDTALTWTRHFWMARRSMEELADFSGRSRRESGAAWCSWYHWVNYRNVGGDRIVVAKIATHNEVAVNRNSSVTNQHVFVIQALEDASSGVLATLGSSTACFWLKQVSQNRGNGGIGGGIASEDWERFYEFTAAKLQELPLPLGLPAEQGQTHAGLAQRLANVHPSAVCRAGIPDRKTLDSARAEHNQVRAKMIALQEDLDWEVYRLYGLLTDEEAADLRANPDALPGLNLGERAFEIVLARKCAAGEMETQWFARHGSTPLTEIPAHWPQAYQDVVRRRIEVIERRRDIALIERPECKRRWQSEPWEKKEAAALRAWLLDRCERRDLWFAPSDTGAEEPQPMTVNRLADRLRGDADFVSVARLYAGPDADLAAVIAEITDAEHVPYLAALRYKDTGLRTRQQWERTWDLQREEDATGQRLDIPVPPKYTSADFRKNSYWSNRGKLDVPKERFISYPLASPDGDGSLLLGWAGWDHRQQAHALMTVIEDRSTRDGWDCERLVPLIAGLAEVMPWVRQWHGEVDPAFGMSPADAYASYLEDQMHRCGVSASDLAAWRPPASGRGRRPRAASAADDSAAPS